MAKSHYYHHGESPAAWAGVVLAAIGFVAAAIGAMIGPNWIVVGIGGALVLAAALTTLVMKRMGYGQP